MNLQGQQVFLTVHAVERFRDRCRPALSIRDARVELNRLLQDHGAFTPRPDWAMTAGLRNGTQAWVMLGPDVLFPVLNTRLTTCLVPGDLHPHERERRRNERHKQQDRRRARSKRNRTSRGRPETEAA